MLYDHRRKRGRQAMAVAPPTATTNTAARTTTARTTAAVNTTRLAAPIVRAHAATERFLEAALPRHSRQQQAWMSGPEHAPTSLRSPTMATAARTTTMIEPAVRRATYASATPELVVASESADVHKMIRHAHRARRLLLDRLTVVNLRRSHRCELLEEITRLKKVLASLQEQVDTTTRNVAKMDRLVHHLQSISGIFTDVIQAPTTAAAAPSLALTVASGDGKGEQGTRESNESLRAAALAVEADERVVQLIEDELEAKAEQPQQVEGAKQGDSSMKNPGNKPLAKDGAVVNGDESAKNEEEEGPRDAEEEQGDRDASTATAAE